MSKIGFVLMILGAFVAIYLAIEPSSAKNVEAWYWGMVFGTGTTLLGLFMFWYKPEQELPENEKVDRAFTANQIFCFAENAVASYERGEISKETLSKYLMGLRSHIENF